MDKFTGEHLLPGQLGHLFVIISFVAALVATFSYYKAAVATHPDDAAAWKKLARGAFLTELAAVVGIVVCLYSILYNHYYEYKFAYKHSNNSLENKYLLSCFWEGQEGSFLVWIFWHCLLGVCVMFSAKKWEAPVMATLSFVQIFLTAFLLGLQFNSFHIGSSPFVLLRNSDMGIGPIFQQKDYLARITDGQGLNILLQNRWMVIHPPTLFLGFATCTIPFAFAIAGLWKREYGNWVKPALPWTILAACILGVGVLMGAKWAYESLSFGGYWAWDPVENASLVPWLIIIAGLHTMLVYKHTGYSLRASTLFILLTFIFVIYSTYLTRSGDLQDTSVHAFTGAGMVDQLRVFLAIMALPPLILFAGRYANIPTIHREEATWSREFWMFIGALVFFLSALFVITATSLPVFNKILGKHWALGENAQAIYNKVHVPIAIVIALLIAVTQYFKYKNTSLGYFGRKIVWPFLISLAIFILFLFTSSIQYNKEGVVFKGLIATALLAAIFMTVANGAYIWQFMRRKVLLWGGSLSHLGFGLLVVGILVSASNKKLLSLNNPPVNIFGPDSKEDPRENLNLLKGLPVRMGNYDVLYKRDYVNRYNKSKHHYEVEFADMKGKKMNLTPTAFLKVKGQEGISPEPSFKSYWDRDVFLYITSLTDPDKRDAPPEFVSRQLKMGDTSAFGRGFFVLQGMQVDSSETSFNPEKGDISFRVKIRLYMKTGQQYEVRPGYFVKNNLVSNPADSVAGTGIEFKIDGVGEQNKLKLSVKDSTPVSDYITIKVLEFPLINLMWAGMIIMSIGLMISMIRRIILLKKEEDKDS
jgi:cytochrome c-type biogenesis protein CcmF